MDHADVDPELPPVVAGLIEALCPALPPEGWSACAEGPALALGGARLVFGAEGVILEGEDEPDLGPLTPLLTHAAALHRLWALLAGPAIEAPDGASGQRRAQLGLPVHGPLLRADGRLALRVMLVQSSAEGDILDVEAAEAPWLALEALGGAEDAAAAWRAQAQAELEAGAPGGVLALLVDAEEPPPVDLDEEGRAEALGVADGLPAEAEAAIEELLQRWPAVAARFAEVYGLRLPVGVAALGALCAALGALPEGPPGAWWEAAPGWERGRAWMALGIGLQPMGVGAWLAPGGLDRPLREAAEAFGGAERAPPGLEGPLDLRLDWRFRCDPPQMITVAAGGGDGGHWGLWWDHPDWAPEVAHNWARDSAETRRVALDLAGLIAALLAREEEERAEALRTAPDDGEAADSLWATRVVARVWARAQAQVEALLLAAGGAPRCPWPLTERAPLGSPTLRLPPGVGPVSAWVPGCGGQEDTPTVAERAAAIGAARAKLQAGAPADALGWGLYLHWLDDDALRPEAAALLADALRALGCGPLAGILEAHMAARDLPDVAVTIEG